MFEGGGGGEENTTCTSVRDFCGAVQTGDADGKTTGKLILSLSPLNTSRLSTKSIYFLFLDFFFTLFTFKKMLEFIFWLP